MIWDELPQNCGIWNGQIAIDTDLVERVISRGRALERVAAAAKVFQNPEWIFNDSWRVTADAQALYKALAELEKDEKGGRNDLG